MTTRSTSSKLADGTDDDQLAKRIAARVAKRVRALRPVLVDPNQVYSIDEAAAALDRSRSSVYKDIARGAITTVRFGRRRSIAGSELLRLLREHVASATASSATAT